MGTIMEHMEQHHAWLSSKNKLTDITLIPAAQLTSSTAHSHQEAMDGHNGLALFWGWRVPCLGPTLIGKLNTSGSSDGFDIMYIIPGPYITFYAIVFLGQWHIISLTSMLSCLECACEGDNQKALYAALDGALDLLVCIDNDAEQFIHTPPNLEHGEYKFPYISK